MQEHKFDAGSTIYREGEPSDSVYMVKAGSVEVLRYHDGELLLAAPTHGSFQISLQHCAIDDFDDDLVVRDLGSAYGTLVNGRRIAEFERMPSAPLHFGTNDIVAGGGESPYRFTLAIERAASGKPSSEEPVATTSDARTHPSR